MGNDFVHLCKWYPQICNLQDGHSGRYCSSEEKCEHQLSVVPAFRLRVDSNEQEPTHD